MLFSHVLFSHTFSCRNKSIFSILSNTSQSQCSHVVYSTSLKVDRSIIFFVSTSKRLHIALGDRKQMESTNIHTPVSPVSQNDRCKSQLKFLSNVIGSRRKSDKNVISRFKNNKKIVLIISINVIATKMREMSLPGTKRIFYDTH